MQNQSKTYPFTEKHLLQFEKEINEAGGFEELMLKKNALRHESEKSEIMIYPAITEYKEKYLVGEYESLRPHYDTEAPYIFWGCMYEQLQKSHPHNNYD